MIPLLLAPIASMLADKGLDLLSRAIDGGAEKAKEFIEDKTGISLDVNKGLTSDEILKLKEFEASNEIKLKSLALENKKEDNRHQEAKYSEAHETYRAKNDMSDEIAKQIIGRNLPLIGILVTVNIILVYFLQDNASLIAIASNIIGVAIGNLFNERQAIVNFFFGSSISSKTKDEHIKNLTHKGWFYGKYY